MKVILFFFFGFLSFSAASQVNGRCEIFGLIHKTENPRHANYRVFVTEDEYLADAVIFVEENQLMADRPGIWYFTDSRGLANFTLFFVDDKSDSDFTIFMTEVPDFARCNN